METINCIFCNKENEEIVISENGYTGRKCSRCALIYISPRPSVNEIVDLYKHDQSNMSSESHTSGNMGKRIYAGHNLHIIKEFIGSGDLLEIGAGAGYFLDESRKEGFEPYGIELNDTQAKFIRGKLGIPCEESPLDDSSFNGKIFDVIYHCDVISHFHDPLKELKKMNGKLRKGGFLVFETGNGGDMEQRYFKYFDSFQYPDHLFFFSENNLKDLLERTGFRLIKIYRYPIVLQLLLYKITRKIINLTGSAKKKSVADNSKPIEGMNIKKSIVTEFMKNAYLCFSYILRYKISFIMPKKGRPQTLIVVASKK